MAITAKNLSAGVLTGSLATVYTVPDNTTAIIKSAVLTNATGGAVNCNVWINPRSGGTDRQVIDTRAVGDTKSDLCAEIINQVIEAGGLLRADGLDVTFVVSGVEIV